MGYVIRMPQMGMSMEQGTVLEWAVAEGASVATDDVLCVVESEKTTADVEARESGVLRRTVVPEGGVVEPGTPIGILAGADEDLTPYTSQIDEAALEAAGENGGGDDAGADGAATGVDNGGAMAGEDSTPTDPEGGTAGGRSGGPAPTAWSPRPTSSG